MGYTDIPADQVGELFKWRCPKCAMWLLSTSRPLDGQVIQLPCNSKRCRGEPVTMEYRQVA